MRSGCLAFVLLAFALASLAHGQDSESVDELLDEEDRLERVEAWLPEPPDFIRSYFEFKQWLAAETGLDVGMQNVTIYQRATGGRRPRDAAINNFSLFGDWHPFAARGVAGEVGFSFERRDTLSNATVREFSDAVGAGYRTNDLSIGTRDRTASTLR